MFYIAGEGNEEISNMIHSYIKEIEDLRYCFLEHVMHVCFCNICSISVCRDDCSGTIHVAISVLQLW